MSEQRYITPDGEPPNGGVPPGMEFVPISQQLTAPAPAPCPPWYPAYMLAPVYTPPAPPDVHHHHYLMAPPPQPSIPSSPPTPPLAPIIERPPTPPGARINGHTIHLDPDLGFGYIFPQDHTIIHYFYDGTQPWLPHGQLHYWKRLVPSSMTVRELIRQMGAPEGNDERNGITECVELGNGTWGKGRTFPIADEASAKSIKDAELGKDREGVVWLAAWTLP